MLFNIHTKLLLLFVVIACSRTMHNGTLLVTAPHAASFEIFRVVSSLPQHFVAEQTASFNDPIVLAPSRYLLLSDCSHTFVTIKAATTTRLQAYHLVFVPPHVTEANASFSVQCQRFASTSSRQHLHNKFSLLLLTPHKKLLVGTTPLNVDYRPTPPMPEDKKRVLPTAAPLPSSTHRQFSLAALQVAPVRHNLRFFVYARHGLLSATESQLSGRWLYLLPGEYVVEFNGMRTAIELQQGEERIIHPAILHVTVPQATQSATASINGDRVVPFNEPLPLPAGQISLRLMPASQPLHLTLRRGAHTIVRARHLQVIPACHGNEICTVPTVSLYRSKANTPFLTTAASEIFFTGKNVQIGVEGTPRLTHLLPNRPSQFALQLGKLQLQPRVIHSTTQFSDLLLLTASALPLQGHSDDLSLSQATSLHLLPGRYQLVHYISSTNPDKPRRKHSTSFTIHPQRTHKMTVPVFKHKRVAKR